MYIQCALLIAMTATYVAGRTCYRGQQPGPYIGEFRWSVADNDPSQCTEYHLGGLNTRPQQILRKIKIGEDSTQGLRSNNTSKVGTTHAEATTVDNSDGACVVFQTNASQLGRFPAEGQLASPLDRLEVNNQPSERFKLLMYLASGGWSIQINLNPDQSTVSGDGSIDNVPHGIRGAHRVWVKLDRGTNNLTIGKNWDEVIMTVPENAALMEIYSVVFWSVQAAEWRIYSPCI